VASGRENRPALLLAPDLRFGMPMSPQSVNCRVTRKGQLSGEGRLSIVAEWHGSKDSGLRTRDTKWQLIARLSTQQQQQRPKLKRKGTASGLERELNTMGPKSRPHQFLSVLKICRKSQSARKVHSKLTRFCLA